MTGSKSGDKKQKWKSTPERYFIRTVSGALLCHFGMPRHELVRTVNRLIPFWKTFFEPFRDPNDALWQRAERARRYKNEDPKLSPYYEKAVAFIKENREISRDKFSTYVRYMQADDMATAGTLPFDGEPTSTAFDEPAEELVEESMEEVMEVQQLEFERLDIRTVVNAMFRGSGYVNAVSQRLLDALSDWQGYDPLGLMKMPLVHIEKRLKNINWYLRKWDQLGQSDQNFLRTVVETYGRWFAYKFKERLS